MSYDDDPREDEDPWVDLRVESRLEMESSGCYEWEDWTVTEATRIRQARERGETIYVYRWKNNPKRRTLYGRKCRVVMRSSAFNSRLVQFMDDGHREVVSGNALRRAKEE